MFLSKCKPKYFKYLKTVGYLQKSKHDFGICFVNLSFQNIVDLEYILNGISNTLMDLPFGEEIVI